MWDRKKHVNTFTDLVPLMAVLEQLPLARAFLASGPLTKPDKDAPHEKTFVSGVSGFDVLDPAQQKLVEREMGRICSQFRISTKPGTTTVRALGTICARVELVWEAMRMLGVADPERIATSRLGKEGPTEPWKPVRVVALHAPQPEVVIPPQAPAPPKPPEMYDVVGWLVGIAVAGFAYRNQRDGVTHLCVPKRNATEVMRSSLLWDLNQRMPEPHFEMYCARIDAGMGRMAGDVAPGGLKRLLPVQIQVGARGKVERVLCETFGFVAKV